MQIECFLSELKKQLAVNFYTGVPDSQLKPLCDTLYNKFSIGSHHIVTANEGAAVGLAAGHYLATGQPALVYMQNSGLGNAVNPIASLLNEKVYGIPCVFVVGWRGEPEIKDEPQHAFQGEITLEQLKLLEIPYMVLSSNTTEKEFKVFLEKAKTSMTAGNSVAFVVKKGGLIGGSKVQFHSVSTMSREAAIKTLLQSAKSASTFVSTTGKTSRELFEVRKMLHQGHEKDFLTVGSMGHASIIALGIAMNKPNMRIWCLDGDGAALMHMGNLVLAATSNCNNLVHIVFNNGAHESVGGMPVAEGKVDFCLIASAAGYKTCLKAITEQEFAQVVVQAETMPGPCFIEVLVALGSRDDLGRPTTTPQQNKKALMCYLGMEVEP